MQELHIPISHRFSTFKDTALGMFNKAPFSFSTPKSEGLFLFEV